MLWLTSCNECACDRTSTRVASRVLFVRVMRIVRLADVDQGDEWERHAENARRLRRVGAQLEERLALRAERTRLWQQEIARLLPPIEDEDIETLPFHTTSTKPKKRRGVAPAPSQLRIVRLAPEGDAAAVVNADVVEVVASADDTPRRQDDPVRVAREGLKPLTSAERGILQRAVDADTLMEFPGYSLRGGDLAKLVQPHCWLDDTVIDAYVKLINARNTSFFESHCEQVPIAGPGSEVTSEVASALAALSTPTRTHSQANALYKRSLWQTRRKSYAFNCYFFKFLCPTPARYNYSSVRNWTTGPIAEQSSRTRGMGKIQRPRILDYTQVLVPVNIGNAHWVLAVVDMGKKQFVYLDSMGRRDGVRGVLKKLRRWLSDEVTAKYGEEATKRLEIENWTTVQNPEHMPRQTDCDSCGMFCLGLAERLELGQPWDFTQADIPLMRKRAALALHCGALPQA